MALLLTFSIGAAQETPPISARPAIAADPEEPCAYRLSIFFEASLPDSGIALTEIYMRGDWHTGQHEVDMRSH